MSHSVGEMRVRGHTVEILRQGTDWEDWRLGIQLALDGQVATMFDLHKSKIAEVGDSTPAYEEMLVITADSLLKQYGPSKAGIPAASPR